MSDILDEDDYEPDWSNCCDKCGGKIIWDGSIQICNVCDTCY